MTDGRGGFGSVAVDFGMITEGERAFYILSRMPQGAMSGIPENDMSVVRLQVLPNMAKRSDSMGPQYLKTIELFYSHVSHSLHIWRFYGYLVLRSVVRLSHHNLRGCDLSVVGQEGDVGEGRLEDMGKQVDVWQCLIRRCDLNAL